MNNIKQLDQLLPAGKSVAALARKHRHLPSSPETFPVTLRKLGFFTLDTTLPHDTNTCTSPGRNVGGTQKSGELNRSHAEVMSNQAADTQLHGFKLRLQYFMWVA